MAEAPPNNCSLPIISWRCPDPHLIQQLLSAQEGAVIFQDMPLKVPMSSVRSTFCKLYEDTKLVHNLVEALPNAALFENKAFYDKAVDQNVSLTWTSSASHTVLETRQDLLQNLGREFVDVIDFFNSVQEFIVPRLRSVTSAAISGAVGGMATAYSGENAEKVMGIHYGTNFDMKLVDYFPVQGNVNRCSEHRDSSTFTLIFQDRLQGGLQVFQNSRWVSVPCESEVVFLWGWCSFILSNGRIPTPLYRVTSLKGGRYGKAPRRNEVAFHFSPDTDAFLRPVLLSPFEALSFNVDAIKTLTTQDLQKVLEASRNKKKAVANGPVSSELPNVAATREQDNDVVNLLLGVASEEN